jgi:hypothetical protein
MSQHGLNAVLLRSGLFIYTSGSVRLHPVRVYKQQKQQRRRVSGRAEWRTQRGGRFGPARGHAHRRLHYLQSPPLTNRTGTLRLCAPACVCACMHENCAQQPGGQAVGFASRLALHADAACHARSKTRRRRTPWCMRCLLAGGRGPGLSAWRLAPGACHRPQPIGGGGPRGRTSNLSKVSVVFVARMDRSGALNSFTIPWDTHPSFGSVPSDGDGSNALRTGRTKNALCKSMVTRSFVTHQLGNYIDPSFRRSTLRWDSKVKWQRADGCPPCAALHGYTHWLQ